MLTKSQATKLKKAVFALLEDHIIRKAPIVINWQCEYCYETHTLNLLDKAVSVKIDYDATIAQPPIALLDEKENMVIAIDIPYKKTPAEEASIIYNENEIVYIQLKPEKNQSLENIYAIITSPFFVSLCFNPTCPDCGQHLHKKEIIVATIECWACSAPMQLAYWTAGGRNGTSADFNETDLELAKSKGVIFTRRHSPFASDYDANTCGSCGKHVGEGYVHNYYYSTPAQTFEAGYHCMNCNIPIFNDSDDF
ncbi:MAG: hypothetical protein QM726_04365 [Chitinophagaceae bacterium]